MGTISPNHQPALRASLSAAPAACSPPWCGRWAHPWECSARWSGPKPAGRASLVPQDRRSRGRFSSRRPARKAKSRRSLVTHSVYIATISITMGSRELQGLPFHPGKFSEVEGAEVPRKGGHLGPLSPPRPPQPSPLTSPLEKFLSSRRGSLPSVCSFAWGREGD